MEYPFVYEVKCENSIPVAKCSGVAIIGAGSAADGWQIADIFLDGLPPHDDLYVGLAESHLLHRVIKDWLTTGVRRRHICAHWDQHVTGVAR